MPASSGLSNSMGTGPTSFNWNGEPGKSGVTTVPPPEAPYIAPISDTAVGAAPYATVAEVNAYIVEPLNELLVWARSVGFIKQTADQ